MTTMPKNRSASRRKTARQLATAHRISYAEALRQLDHVTPRTRVDVDVDANLQMRRGGCCKTTVTVPMPDLITGVGWIKCDGDESATPSDGTAVTVNARVLAAPRVAEDYSLVLIDPLSDSDTAAINQRICDQLGDEGHARLLNELTANRE